MILYSSATASVDHMVRFVVKEKNIEIELRYVKEDELSEQLMEHNPYHSTMTLIDRQLSLYQPQITMEYLDERFPYPPLMPVDPAARAQNRQFRYRIMRDLCSVLDDLGGDNEIASANARRSLRDHLSVMVPLFVHKQFFMSDEFTLVDCCMAPLLWRLPHFGVKLPVIARRRLDGYAKKLFDRESFQNSMTDEEREFRDLL